MPNSIGTIRLNKLLTSMSVKYSNGMFVADEISPRVSVDKETDTYIIYGREDFFGEKAERAMGANPNYVPSLSTSTATYTCFEYELADMISDREISDSTPPLSLKTDKMNNLTRKISLAREIRVASLFTTQGNFASSNREQLSGTEQFNNSSFDSDSKTDAIEVRIDAGKEAIRAAIGMDPNVIIIPSAVARVVKKDEEIRELIKYTQDNLLVNGDLPETMFNMKVVIPGGIYASNNRGATFSGADIWGKHIVMAYIAPNPNSKDVMTFVSTFEQTGREVNEWREEAKRSTAIEVREILTEKIVAADAGYLIEDCIA